MTPAEKAAIVSGLTNAVYELARAGIRQRHPDAAPREQFLRLALITLGPELATRAYPDAARLDRSCVAGDRVLHVHPPEDILLQKLRWYEKGGGISDRQWRDILAIVRVQGGRLDREYLVRYAPALGVSALLERALREGAAD